MESVKCWRISEIRQKREGIGCLSFYDLFIYVIYSCYYVTLGETNTPSQRADDDVLF